MFVYDLRSTVKSRLGMESTAFKTPVIALQMASEFVGDLPSIATKTSWERNRGVALSFLSSPLHLHTMPHKHSWHDFKVGRTNHAHSQ